MKREARLLLDKACDSLLLSIEFFNRPQDRGRVTAVLILLDHSFEMLLKAAIVHRGGRIREKRARETLGFDACVRKGLSDGKVKFLNEEQALSLQAINGLRDAAQHHLLVISEPQLYLHAQAVVTLFRDLLKSVFDRELLSCVPKRVLPVSTTPPTNLEALFDSEVSEIRKLLGPGSRRQIEARARLRPLAILDGTIRGEKGQSSKGELSRLGERLVEEPNWRKLFPGVAAIDITTEGNGPTLSLRFTKKEGVPVHIVPEGTPGASVVAIKRVDELGFYNLGHSQLAEHVGLSGPMVTALTRAVGIQSDTDCFKEVAIGRTKFKRYSQKAVQRLKEAKQSMDLDQVWENYRPRKKMKGRL